MQLTAFLFLSCKKFFNYILSEIPEIRGYFFIFSRRHLAT